MRIIFCLLTLATLFSCTQETYTIIGKVDNYEGKELVFSVDGEFENRHTQQVNHGQVVFTGYYNGNQNASIYSLYNLEHINGVWTSVPLIIEKDTIVVHFTVQEEMEEIDDNVFEKSYSFENIQFKQGEVNILRRKLSKDLFKIYGESIIDMRKMDSLRQFVFPKWRTSEIQFYQENLFGKKIDQAIKLNILSRIVGGFSTRYVEDITANEKEKYNNFFSEIANQERLTSQYNKVKVRIDKINGIPKPEVSFFDKELTDDHENVIQLSEIVKNNEYTVFYFWASWCGPCRYFNGQMVQEYNSLKEAGIEVIHINMDLYNKHWEKASKQDSIFWTNLYAGEDVELITRYQLEGYPTKVIFNKEAKKIDFKFNNPSELIQLIED